jgi:hypothetical protein
VEEGEKERKAELGFELPETRGLVGRGVGGGNL